MAIGQKSRYTIRPPFSIHLAWFEIVEDNGTKRKIRREQSYFSGMGPIELSDEDALAHMHKLEPADAASKKLFDDYHEEKDKAIAARQSQDGNTKSMAAQITQAVIEGLVASGLIKPPKV